MTPDVLDEHPQGRHGDAARAPAIDASRYAWPEVQLDPVARMRALASGMPHVAVDETVLDVPFDRVWSFITDFEVNTAKYEAAVGRARVLRHDGDRLTLEARGPLFGPWMHFDVVVRPGWCLMRSRIGQIGMAARPEDETATRFIHFEGSAVLGRILRPVFAWNIRRDFERLRALLQPKIKANHESRK